MKVNQEALMRGRSLQLSLAVGAAAILATACRSPQEPAPEVAAELMGARIPSAVAPGTSFQLVAYFLHGACDEPRPVVELAPAGATIGLRLLQRSIPKGSACPDIALRDSVAVVVTPPITLPYTVRLQRRSLPDSVVIVQASEPGA